MRALRSGVPFAPEDSHRLAWTKGEIKFWQEKRGTITQVVHGNRVDLFVHLETWAAQLFRLLVWAAATGLVFVFWRIVSAFITGRVTAVLHAAMNGGLR